jgi:hypothetical protein
MSNKRITKKISKILDKFYDEALTDKRHTLTDEADGVYSPKLDEHRQKQDFDSPASDAHDTMEPKISQSHPATDSDIDAHEAYDEGLTGASGVTDGTDGDAKPKRL